MGVFKAAAVQMRSGTDPQRNAADFERFVRDGRFEWRALRADAGDDQRDGA